jgi:integrase
MARHSEGPWFRKGTNSWYATADGKNVPLGVRGRGNRKAAWEAWRSLMAGGGTPEEPDPHVRIPRNPGPEPAAAPTVRELADLFLSDAGSRLKPTTVRIYKNDLGSLCRSCGALPADTLTAHHVARWLASLDVASTTKAIMLRSVSACLNWAARCDLIPSNPARKVPKPKARSRSEDAVITDDEHRRLLDAATPQFRVVLRVLHGTGARPGEVCGITSETFDPASGVVKLTEHKTDRTGRPRLIFPPPDVLDLLRELLARWGSGPLLRSRRGKPYTGRAVTKAMQYLRKKTGVHAIAYGYRHSYATDALVNGVPDATVAALLGHADTTVLHRHYSHLGSRADALREAAARVRGGLPAAG